MVLAFALLVVAGGIAVHGDTAPFGIEVRIQDRIDEHAGGDSAWKPVFEAIPWAIGFVLAALALWALAERWWRGIVAGLAVPLAIALAEWVLKPIVARDLPGDIHLYPSGHLTAVAAAATVMVAFVGPRLSSARLSSAGLQPGLQLGLAFLVTAVCAVCVVSAIATHSHGFVDTIAGIPTGAAVALAWMLTVDAVAQATRKRTT